MKFTTMFSILVGFFLILTSFHKISGSVTNSSQANSINCDVSKKNITVARIVRSNLSNTILPDYLEGEPVHNPTIPELNFIYLDLMENPKISLSDNCANEYFMNVSKKWDSEQYSNIYNVSHHGAFASPPLYKNITKLEDKKFRVNNYLSLDIQTTKVSLFGKSDAIVGFILSTAEENPMEFLKKRQQYGG